MPTCRILLTGMFAGLFAFGAAPTQAQPFPSKPIRLIVPYTPGAGGDIVSRVLAEKLGASLGQPIVVENKGGASGAIGTAAGATAPADGHTWILGADPAFTINPLLRKVPYDPLKDFAPVVLLTKVPLVLVINPALGINNIRELVADAKKNPGKLTVASLGSGSNAHLAVELLNSMAGIKTLLVPFKGQAEALIGVIGGTTDLTFSSIGSVMPHLKSGKLKAIGITTDQRFEGLPDVPTIAESGFPGFEVSAWHGIVVPAETPRDIVVRINQEFGKALAQPDIAARLTGLGYLPVGGGPENLERLLKRDTEKWAKLIREVGITAD
ncbi:MAG: tripartite tricarboxylate transporter substrate binding protein [Betaproteobacteria bacterium]|nr:tripartite tricarboxylate transporter substrate binding protein [Betaproteobacteria bacterium]